MTPPAVLILCALAPMAVWAVRYLGHFECSWCGARVKVVA